MSTRLRSCKDFLRTILKGTLLQAEALLVTATNAQVNCLGEVFFNLLRLPLGKKCKVLVAKYRKILDVVGDLNLSVRKRLILIQKHVRKILMILMASKNRILSLLTD